ncbi:O-acetylserine/cysteine exporter [Tistrella bauzanensis]|uniref:O-acetylserine/cysteine exporter n=1 Tax=Tistrella bauzanensis TaxID=657419 RepID=A0ABQ1I845_9PROT|nr:EamA family transporter [Tistrella bauzanensis]GGB23480.1 O-acetylserine/cysteine exporter [Tistrella bauzanensis]
MKTASASAPVLTPMTPAHILLALLVVAIWGCNFVAVKVATAAIPPLFLVALRFGVLFLLLAPFLPMPRRSQIPKLAAIGMTLGVGHFGLMFVALSLGVDASTLSVAIQIEVPFAALCAMLVLGERMGPRQIAGLVLGMIGVALVAGDPKVLTQLDGLGVGLLAGGFWAYSNIQIKQLGQLGAVPPQMLNAWLGPFCVLPLLVLSFIFESGQGDALSALNWQTIAALAYILGGASLVAYGAWYFLLGRYSVGQVTIYMLLVPVFGVLGGVVMMGETLGLLEMIGGALIVSGVAVVQLRRLPGPLRRLR